MIMALAVFDIGGTSVKCGRWENNQLYPVSSFQTPLSWAELKMQLKNTFDQIEKVTGGKLEGAAFSSPGSVYSEEGVVRGFSAVSYLHHFPIRDELETLLGVPVTLENDANCAALAETWQGVARGVDNVVFIVIGTGIGGAIILNGELIKGRNLFGGEFGYMLLTDTQNFSDLASPVAMAKKYQEENKLLEQISGEKIFQLALEGDAVASRYVNDLRNNLARGIQNLLVAYNPDMVVIGGGMSAQTAFIQSVEKRVKELLVRTRAQEVDAIIVPCQFQNQANLIGAVASYYKQIGSKKTPS